MNRRQLLKLASLTSIALATGATTITLDGCTFNITDAINTVLNSALAILKVSSPGASWIGPLGSAINALENAETQWQAGSAATIVIDALNTLELVLSVIPATAVYTPLIDILVAGIEAVMSAFGTTVQASADRTAKRRAIVNSPHYKAATLKRPSFAHPTWQGAYKSQWNSEAVALNLPQAEIK